MVFRFLRAPNGTNETHKTSSQENPKGLEYQYSTNPLGDLQTEAALFSIKG
jgi:hypothetical protein